MRFLTCCLAICLAQIFSASSFAQNSSAGASQGILKYVPDGTLGLIHFSVAPTFRDPSMRLYPTEIMTAAGEEEFGFDPLLIESVDVAVAMPGPQGPDFGAVVKLNQPLDMTTLEPALVDVEQVQEVKGKKYYPLLKSPEMYLHQVDQQTCLAGTLPFLQLMALAKHGQGRVAKFAEVVKFDQATTLIVVDMLSLRPLLEGGLEQAAEQLPPAVLDASKTLVSSADMLAIRGMVTSQALQVLLQGDDEAAAGKMETAWMELLQFGRQIIQQQVEMNLSDSKQDAAMKAYTVRVSEEILSLLKPKKSGNRLIVQASFKEQGQFMTMGIAAGLLLPAIQAAREAATRTSSMNSLRQIALAQLNYESTYSKLPDNIRDKDGVPLLSWRVAILPYIEEQDLYERFHLDEPWDSPHNITLLEEIPAVYYKAKAEAPPGYTVYVMPSGKEYGVLGAKYSTITDGTSNTVLALESPGIAAVPWTAPYDLEIDPENPLAVWVDSNASVINAVFCDGAGRALIPSISPEEFLGMLTPAGEEVLSNF